MYIIELVRDLETPVAEQTEYRQLDIEPFHKLLNKKMSCALL